MSNIVDAFVTGARAGFTQGAGATGLVLQGALQGAEAALQDPDVRTAAETAVAGGVEAATTAVVGNIRADFDAIRDAAAEGLNANDVGLWTAIKERVTGGSTGLKKIFRFGLAGMLWGGLTLASFVGVGFIRRSHLKDDADVPNTAAALRKMMAGAITTNRAFDRARIDMASNLIVG